jgi:hypothetical protein
MHLLQVVAVVAVPVAVGVNRFSIDLKIAGSVDRSESLPVNSACSLG